MNRPSVFLFASLLCASLFWSIAICQDATTPRPDAPPPPGMGVTTMRLGPISGHVKPVTGAPYCADEVHERVQTLADGTHITSDNRTLRQCRDSAGRTRREEPIAWGQPESITLIHIDDPVANVRYILDPQNKIAHRHPLAREEGESMEHRLSPGTSTTTISATPAVKAGAKSENPRPQTTSENLGKETIEGVIANGRRSTTTYPVGAVGNDREFTATHEDWLSPQLHLDILTKQVDPRYGEDTRKLTNISTAEPDPALFQVPEGYTVSDDEEFRVQWKTRPQ